MLLLFLCSRLVSRPMERGSLAYLLSGPIRRVQIILTQAAALLPVRLAVTLYVFLSGVCFLPPGLLRIRF